ncbi:UDP-N-acetylmuramoyl-tripeptide--D-alanyl-D-alanine ligase [bacterium]|nr:UDP-N-acetylmuramoyl-tripeptide--D-alanyl-D-alanine ligase [bacterium]
MNISKLYNIFKEYPSISTDSRNIKKDSIFFALKGENFNGNKFAEEALKSGCKYAVIDEKEYEINENYILVNNALKTLQQLASLHRDNINIPIIAITGTNGKTTSKELITSCLSSELETAYTKGNYNNHIGVPLTLLEINKKHEISIIEMGANHKNEINFLCEIAKPNYGIITNIGKAHLEGFKNFEGVKSTKKELYDYIKKNNGVIFINNDDKTLNEISKNIKSITYGKNGDIIGEEATSSVYTEVLFNKIKINSNLIGSYQFYNIMLAIAVAQHFSIKEKNIIKSLESYYPKNNRSQVVQSKSNLIILDAYNANPSSMNEMINSFYKIKKEGKVCILGDMGELGIFSKDEHEEIIKLNKKLNLKTFYIGSEFKKLTKKNSFIDFQEFKNYLKDFPITNSTILIKGSRSQKLENIVELL